MEKKKEIHSGGNITCVGNSIDYEPEGRGFCHTFVTVASNLGQVIRLSLSLASVSSPAPDEDLQYIFSYPRCHFELHFN